MEQTFVAWFRRCALAFVPRALLVLSALLLPPLGCSSAAKCDSARCPSGSECIDDHSGAGSTCHQVCTQQATCPFNSYCNDARPKSWCTPNTIRLAQHPGQWGVSCLPSDGEVNNPACDTADGFACYGTSPTDANAFCTILGKCTVDSDCPGGWWCAVVDVAPNVTTAKRSFGAIRSVCLPRQYCATCKLDHDCPVAADKTQQHCVPDSLGNGLCSPQCATSSNCPFDATCQPLSWGICAQKICKTDPDCRAFTSAETCIAGACRVACVADADCPASNGARQHCGIGGWCVAQTCASDDDCPPARGIFQHCNAGACTPECAGDADCNAMVGDQSCVPLSVCTPRAGVCVGDGTFCAPCGSDYDCLNGFCLAATYSTERFCSQAMQGATCTSTGPPKGSCPTRPSSANYKGIACTTATDDFAPANTCIAEVSFGLITGMVQYVPGCWTMNR